MKGRGRRGGGERREGFMLERSGWGWSRVEAVRGGSGPGWERSGWGQHFAFFSFPDLFFKHFRSFQVFSWTYVGGLDVSGNSASSRVIVRPCLIFSFSKTK